MTAHFMEPFDKLHLEEVDGAEGRLEQPLRFYSAVLQRVVVAPPGWVTDFASIPRFFWRVVPKRGKHDRAAVLHDAGYRDLLQDADGRLLTLPKNQIDQLFNEVMAVSGVPGVQRVGMYRAVSWFGGKAFSRARDCAAICRRQSPAGHTRPEDCDCSAFGVDSAR